MYLLDEGFYRETKNIALNLSDKSELVNALSDWFKQTYSIEVINVQFGRLSPSRERYRLYVIIGNQDDYRKSLHGPFQNNEDLVAQVSSEFRRLALKYRYLDCAICLPIFSTPGHGRRRRRCGSPGNCSYIFWRSSWDWRVTLEKALMPPPSRMPWFWLWRFLVWDRKHP
jgi:hypothetical protein